MPSFFRRVAAVAFGVFAADALSEEWPWNQSCRQRYLNLNISECDIRSRSDLPQVDNGSTFEIFVLSHPVEGVIGETISSLVGFTHTAIGIREHGGSSELYLEYFALDFGVGLVVPSLEDGALAWSNAATIGWKPSISRTEWIKNVSVGRTSGDVINRFLDWVPGWLAKHGTYELLSVWSAPELAPSTKRYFNGTTCHSFTEASLWEMHRLGVSLSSGETICSNYAVLVADSPLQRVEGLLSKLEMHAFYGTLEAVAAKFAHVGWWQLLGIVSTALVERESPAAFVFDGDLQTYYHVSLKQPFLGIRTTHVDQRMILPWQTADGARLGECDPLAPLNTLIDSLRGSDLLVV